MLGDPVGSVLAGRAGDVIIGSVTCSQATQALPDPLPVPLASGLGLLIGLVITAALAIPAAAILRRRRLT